jgi:hypothetical protein
MFLTSEILLLTAALYCFAFYLLRWLRRKLLIKETAVADLEPLGQLRPNGQKLHGTAVICGGRRATIPTARFKFQVINIIIHLASLVW